MTDAAQIAKALTPAHRKWAEVHPLVMANLCVQCVHGMNCVEPLPSFTEEGGHTCLSYEPERGEPMRPEHIIALPDREPCDDCACRKNTTPNQTHHTMVNLKVATDRLEPFLCHDGGSGRVCAGWLRAAKARIAGRAVAAELEE